MKRISFFLTFLSVAVLMAQIATAQEKDTKDEKHEIHLKFNVVKDDVEKVTDAALNEAEGDAEIIEILKLSDIPDSLRGEHIILKRGSKEFWQCEKMLHSSCFVMDSTTTTESGNEIRIIRKIKHPHGHKHSSHHIGDTAQKEIKFEMMDKKGHVTNMFLPNTNKEGEIIIIEDCEDVEITEEDGYKIIRIKIEDDHKGHIKKDIDVEAEVETSEPNKEGKPKRSKRPKKKR